MSRDLRLVLADDHSVLRSGLRRLLESSGMSVVAEGDTGEQAYRLFVEFSPDVLVMDLSMPGIGGLEAVRRIVSRHADARIVIFSMHENAGFATQALRAGARGYVTKSGAADELVSAVLAASIGKLYISPSVAQKIALQNITGEEDPAERLSTREFEIFRLLAEGHDAEAISGLLNISHKTVSNYQTLLKQKLGVSSPVELVRLAMKHGVIEG